MSDRVNFKVSFLLIFAISLLMLGAGVMSAYVGYLMGREALKVVTQPDANSENPVLEHKSTKDSQKGLKIIEEKTILVNVYNYIYNQTKKGDSEQSSTKSPSQLVSQETSSDNLSANSFPIKDRAEGVTMEISQAKFQGSSLILGVNLKNESSQTRRFLYSFLDVRDDKNQPLSVIAEGLPGELPANGENFSGSLMVPLTLLDNSRNISLTLTDYPDQKLKLQLDRIPVTK